MLKKGLIFFTNLIISATAFSYVTLNGVSGTSYFDPTAKKIYAGFAGTCASPNAGSTCDTCTDVSGAGLKPCNQKSIHSALAISFSFRSATDLSAKTIALFVGDSETSNTQVTSSTGSVASSDMTLSTTWSSFCGTVTDLNSDCSVSSSGDQTVSTTKAFYIGADENGVNGIESTEKLRVDVALHSISATSTGLHTQSFCVGTPVGYGLCNYKLESGDEKLIIQGANSLAQSTPPTGSPEFSAVAFFAYKQPNSSAVITPSAVSNGQAQIIVKDIVSPTDFTFKPDDYLNGLTNIERYCVIAGQMNLAQNIFSFTTTGLVGADICQSPSEVVGLLDDKHCFISTAAFGSDMASEVQIFRQFRNTFLLTNQLGIGFTKFYYQYGPMAAEFISESEALKTLTRGFLYPLVGFSWLALNYGMMSAVLVLILSMIFLFNLRKHFAQIFNPKAAREKFNT